MNSELTKKREEYESDLTRKREEYKSAVDLVVTSLLNNEELVQMATNFIDKFPPELYTGVPWITSVEISILQKGEIGKLVLLSTDESRKKYRRNVGDYLNEISLFTNFICEQFNLSDPILAIYATYVFIYKVSIKHFSKKWADEYQGYFQDINGLDLDSWISCYCSIDTIDPKDSETAGIFIYYLMDNQKFINNVNYLECNDIFVTKLEKILEAKNYKNFVDRLKVSHIKREYSIDDVDMMNGLEFEQFIALLFSKLGYQTEVTKASGDQGIDVILSKNGKKIGIQAKCYAGKVGNKSIQEAVAGMKYYHLDKAMVVTNNSFTVSANQLADVNSIVLWDRNILKEKILEVFPSSLPNGLSKE
jgi:hypothetical protein